MQAPDHAAGSILRMLSVSTKHISKSVASRLGAMTENALQWQYAPDPNPFCVAGYEFGWMVGIPDNIASTDEPPNGVPEELLRVLKYADSIGCTHVLLDCEGSEHDLLPQYEWD